MRESSLGGGVGDGEARSPRRRVSLIGVLFVLGDVIQDDGAGQAPGDGEPGGIVAGLERHRPALGGFALDVGSRLLLAIVKHLDHVVEATDGDEAVRRGVQGYHTEGQACARRVGERGAGGVSTRWSAELVVGQLVGSSSEISRFFVLGRDEAGAIATRGGGDRDAGGKGPRRRRWRWGVPS